MWNIKNTDRNGEQNSVSVSVSDTPLFLEYPPPQSLLESSEPPTFWEYFENQNPFINGQGKWVPTMVYLECY